MGEGPGASDSIADDTLNCDDHDVAMCCYVLSCVVMLLSCCCHVIVMLLSCCCHIVVMLLSTLYIQGVFFHWASPKNHKF